MNHTHKIEFGFNTIVAFFLGSFYGVQAYAAPPTLSFVLCSIFGSHEIAHFVGNAFAALLYGGLSTLGGIFVTFFKDDIRDWFRAHKHTFSITNIAKGHFALKMLKVLVVTLLIYYTLAGTITVMNLIEGLAALGLASSYTAIPIAEPPPPEPPDIAAEPPAEAPAERPVFKIAKNTPANEKEKEEYP
ncbi:hypothetical protein SAMN05421780_1243 [Flexibacter flexilis DSM 6793]|uniref:Uncharacterized protein n=1 Tax=Flexibacter flexilis DSM 6793 TaxID=927664 RepID=A0A1I1P632_9BACT|nr:hypothetical protein [Flexibacter flexilis]SFD02453.1 hypothetical protein SAMN05421780_1243 [Flexibacter flexilis DSM 6793]